MTDDKTRCALCLCPIWGGAICEDCYRDTLGLMTQRMSPEEFMAAPAYRAAAVMDEVAPLANPGWTDEDQGAFDRYSRGDED